MFQFPSPLAQLTQYRKCHTSIYVSFRKFFREIDNSNVGPETLTAVVMNIKFLKTANLKETNWKTKKYTSKLYKTESWGKSL
jgi:hypothetical protein